MELNRILAIRSKQEIRRMPFDLRVSWRRVPVWVGFGRLPVLMYGAAKEVGDTGYYGDLALTFHYPFAWTALLAAMIASAASVSLRLAVPKWAIRAASVLGLGPEIVLTVPITLHGLGFVDVNRGWYRLLGRVVHFFQLPGEWLVELTGTYHGRWWVGLVDPKTMDTLISLVVLNLMNLVGWSVLVIGLWKILTILSRKQPKI